MSLGIRLKELNNDFIDIITASENNPLLLTIYNWKQKSVREMIITPNRLWGGKGLLGVTIRFDSFENAELEIIHIVNVEKDSPAELCGLIPDTDYLLGTNDTVFKDCDVLFEVLNQYLDKPLEVFVYSSDLDAVRKIVLMCSSDWSPDGTGGILGAEVAFGYLHVLPAQCSNSLGVCSPDYNFPLHDSPFEAVAIAPAGEIISQREIVVITSENN